MTKVLQKGWICSGK